MVDAMYRSRALDLPGSGHVMVPCVDMANHASGEETTALYETDEKRNAVLQLRWGKKLYPGEEITITYVHIPSYTSFEGKRQQSRFYFEAKTDIQVWR
jgi:hypothetical protein